MAQSMLKGKKLPNEIKVIVVCFINKPLFKGWHKKRSVRSQHTLIFLPNMEQNLMKKVRNKSFFWYNDQSKINKLVVSSKLCIPQQTNSLSQGTWYLIKNSFYYANYPSVHLPMWVANHYLKYWAMTIGLGKKFYSSHWLAHEILDMANGDKGWLEIEGSVASSSSFALQHLSVPLRCDTGFVALNSFALHSRSMLVPPPHQKSRRKKLSCCSFAPSALPPCWNPSFLL